MTRQLIEPTRYLGIFVSTLLLAGCASAPMASEVADAEGKKFPQTLRASAVAHAETPQVGRVDEVTRIDIVDYGIYMGTKIRRLISASSPTGFNEIVTDVRLISGTRNIPARQGTLFGFRYVVVGLAGAVVPLHFVAVCPPPGLHNPATQQVEAQSESEGSAAVGRAGYYGYEFTNAWEASPGIWRLQIWHHGRQMVEQQFVVTE